MTEFSFFFLVNYPWACDSSVISKLTHILVVDPWCVTLTTSAHTHSLILQCEMWPHTLCCQTEFRDALQQIKSSLNTSVFTALFQSACWHYTARWNGFCSRKRKWRFVFANTLCEPTCRPTQATLIPASEKTRPD